MSRSVVSILPIQDCRIIKQIIIVSKIANQETSIGYILYEREFRNNYKFSQVPDEEKDILYFLDYPKQSSYPSDKVDHIILQSVLNKFPKSVVRNHTLITTNDQGKIATLQNAPTEKCILDFTPDFSRADLERLVGIKFDGLNFGVNIYADSSQEHIQNQRFFGYFDMNDKTILDEIQNVKFL